MRALHLLTTALGLLVLLATLVIMGLLTLLTPVIWLSGFGGLIGLHFALLSVSLFFMHRLWGKPNLLYVRGLLLVLLACAVRDSVFLVMEGRFDPASTWFLLELLLALCAALGLYWAVQEAATSRRRLLAPLALLVVLPFAHKAYNSISTNPNQFWISLWSVAQNVYYALLCAHCTYYVWTGRAQARLQPANATPERDLA